MKKIKSFKVFENNNSATQLNEAFSREAVFYKIVNYLDLPSIKKNGLLPGPEGGTYTIAEENFDDWLTPNKLFGSVLQALLFTGVFPESRLQRCVLLKIRMKPEQVKVRNIDLMLKDMKKWQDSIVDIDDFNDVDFEISEYIIMGQVPPSKIEVVSEFVVVDDIKKYKIDPQSLKDYVFGLSNNLKKIGKISIPRVILKYLWLRLKLKFS